MYSIKLESLKEMYKFLDLYDTPELNQDYLSNLNRPITSVQREKVIKISHPKKSPGSDVFNTEFIHNFKEQQMSMLLKLF